MSLIRLVISWVLALAVINAFRLQDDPDIWLNQRVWAWVVVATVLGQLSDIASDVRHVRP